MTKITDEAAIRELLGAYAQALNNSDAKTAASLYANSGAFYPNNLPTAIGSEILNAYEDIFNSIKLNISFEIHEVVVDGDTAFATTGSNGEVTVLDQELTVPEQNRELFVFVREAQVWKIGRYMFNKSVA